VPMRGTICWDGDAMRRVPAYVCLLGLLGAGACTPANLNTSSAGTAVPDHATVSLGTILSMRTVTAPDGGSPLQAGLLADAGGAMTPNDTSNRPVMEFIVRQDDGAIISIVQSNQLGFSPGDRVSILRDNRARLARPG
jgi:outer membrane lipoprotein SlyB